MGVFRMPSLGADMDEGTLLEWLVGPGDEVHRGDVIAVVDTAKSAIDVEVFENGVIAELLIEPGVQVPVGTPLARIEQAGAQEAEPAPKTPEPAEAAVQAEQKPTVQTESSEAAVREPAESVASAQGKPAAPKLTPPMRHLLHQFGLEPRQVAGTGPEGQITRQDVLAAAGESQAARPSPAEPALASPAERVSPPPAPAQSRPRVTPRARRLARERGVDLSGATGSGASGAVTAADLAKSKPRRVDRTAAMRAATAALMGRAAREIPHYYVVSTFDMTPTLQWLREHNADLKPRDRVLPAALFLRAAVVAAVKVPELNGHWDEEFKASAGVDLGVAVATRGGGLVTPRIVDAQDLDLGQLMSHLTDLVKRAKAGRLRGSELQPGSLTVSSLADAGPDVLYGVIYPPQVALVGIGAVGSRPMVLDGELAVRSTVTVTLAADHRATDGRTGARFLSEFGQALTHPEEL